MIFISLGTMMGEILCKLLDDKLKKGVKGLSDNEVEQVLDKSMILFRFLQVPQFVVKFCF